MARPTKYKPEYVELAYNYCLLGATDAQLAVFFEVNVDSIYEWKKRHPEFSDALRKGKDQADALVAESLFGRARGYSHPEDKIFVNQGVETIVPTTKHYPPDTTACIFWLKNRQPETWSDRKEIDFNDKTDLTDTERRQRIASILSGGLERAEEKTH